MGNREQVVVFLGIVVALGGCRRPGEGLNPVC